MLIGRQSELSRIGAALEEHRLVTLTGPGGVGKTALATAVIPSVVDRDTYVADLTSLTGGSIREGVAGDLRFRSFDQLVQTLSGRPSLLVLDNCEHVLDAAAAVVTDLLAASTRVSILATSREALAVPGERVVAVAPLDTAGSSSPAQELFVREAARRGLGTGPTDDVVALCRRLDGLPLALELAANRLAVVTEREMLDHLQLRLDLFSRARARGPDRHQSLAAAIDWSYSLLSPDLRRRFIELSVLPAPFTLDAASAVTQRPAEAVVVDLAALVERSLLVHVVDGGRSRYRLLETIRVFGLDRLGDDRVAVEQRLRAHAREAAESILAAAGKADPRVTRLLADSYRTIRWALLHGVEHDADPADAIVLTSSYWWLEDVGHQADAADTVETVLARWADAGSLGASWGVLAGLHRYAGRHDRAVSAAERALADEDRLGQAYARRTLGQFARTDGRWDEARRHFRAGVEAAREAGATAVALEIELHLGITDARSGDVAAAVERLDSVAQRTEHRFGLVRQVAHVFLAWVLLAEDPQRATWIARAALDAADGAQPYFWGVGGAHMTLGLVALTRDDVAAAADHATCAIEAFHEIRDRTGLGLTLLIASAVLATAGDADGATATASARHDHLPGELGRFEERLLAGTGADLDVDPSTPSLPVTDVLRRLERIASGATRSVSRIVVNHDMCTVLHEGRQARLRTSKGLVDLCTLVARPGKEVAALDLMGAAVVTGDAGPMLDAESRRRYEARIRELKQMIDEASAVGDTTVAEAHQWEFDQLVGELSAAFGLGGRTRTVGDPGEKARSAVTHRIRDAIRRVGEVHPRLGDHLRGSVRTGRYCAYAPDPPVIWEVVVDVHEPDPATAARNAKGAGA